MSRGKRRRWRVTCKSWCCRRSIIAQRDNFVGTHSLDRVRLRSDVKLSSSEISLGLGGRNSCRFCQWMRLVWICFVFFSFPSPVVLGRMRTCFSSCFFFHRRIKELQERRGGWSRTDGRRPIDLRKGDRSVRACGETSTPPEDGRHGQLVASFSSAPSETRAWLLGGFPSITTVLLLSVSICTNISMVFCL